jgi:hypothetical protein
MSELKEIHKKNFNEIINAKIVEVYSFFNKDKISVFISKTRSILELILKDYLAYALESLPSVTYDINNNKNTLEGDISFLYKQKLISSKMNMYMHIIRQAGNSAAHIEIENIDNDYADICEKAIRGIILWYTREYLDFEYDIKEAIKKSGTVVTIRNVEHETKKSKGKKLKGIGFEFKDMLFQIIVSIIIMIIIGFIINKFYFF